MVVAMSLKKMVIEILGDIFLLYFFTLLYEQASF